jgi:hypothetical protein
MSHFKKATSFAREARGPKPKQTDEPAQQEGPLGAYARSLLRQQQYKREHMNSAQDDNGAIWNNYVVPVDLDDPGKWHIMARQGGPGGAYAQRRISEHMEETRRAFSARNKGAMPP